MICAITCPRNQTLVDHKGDIDELHQAAFFDDDKEYMGVRIKRLHTGRAWAEEPSSRTRHLVSNVRVRPLAADNEFEANSIFYIYRSRLERQLDSICRPRVDVLRRVDNAYGWQIATVRSISISHTVIG